MFQLLPLRSFARGLSRAEELYSTQSSTELSSASKKNLPAAALLLAFVYTSEWDHRLSAVRYTIDADVFLKYLLNLGKGI